MAHFINAIDHGRGGDKVPPDPAAVPLGTDIASPLRPRLPSPNGPNSGGQWPLHE